MNHPPNTFAAGLAACFITAAGVATAQTDAATNDAEHRREGVGRIVIETRAEQPKLPVYYAAVSSAVAEVGPNRVEHSIELTLRLLQGDADTVSLGLNGPGEITDVAGEAIVSWSVRRQGDKRFLDLQPKEDAKQLKATISARSVEHELPAPVQLLHLSPGDAIGFDSRIRIEYEPEVEGKIVSATGFAPLQSDGGRLELQTATGGELMLALYRRDGGRDAVELADTRLEGQVAPDGNSVTFQLRATATVAEAGEQITVLSGAAAFSRLPSGDGYRVRLATVQGKPVYKLVFQRAGEHSIELDFVASATDQAGTRSFDFSIASSAVAPMTLKGLGEDVEFDRDGGKITPTRGGDSWVGFLPASGRVRLGWKSARKANDGKLFYTTSGRIEARLGAGLLRQEHQIQYSVLQGELSSLSLLLKGPGDILDVQGANLTGWRVTGAGDNRRLGVTLNRPIEASERITIRSQTALDAFPVQVEGMRLIPEGSIRHAGFLRLSNLGSVRLEPTGLVGLTQLAVDQFPGEAVAARQAFVYRFPAAEHRFKVAADRIQPEVGVSQLLIYQLAETDRVIDASIELDIREAPIREWDFVLPADYSVVSVTGAGVADHVAGTQAVDGKRSLTVVFGADMTGRQLIRLSMEKNVAAEDGQWQLPRIDHPSAKSVRGNVGVVGAPGYRLAIEASRLLVEQPLSYFPKAVPNLQQAFRIREPGWSATMSIESLERSVQSDVFHLYSLSQGAVYGSALVNYFVTGAPVSEWRLSVPRSLGNVIVEGQDVRTWRKEGDTLIVSLHQAVMGPYTLLVTYEQEPDEKTGAFEAGIVAPIDVQSERGYVQVVSPMLVELKTESSSDDLLKLDPLELPAEFRLLSTAPTLGAWQYTERPFDLSLAVKWFQAGATAPQVIEFSEANSRVSKDGELVTDILYYVKSRGQRALRIKLPKAPVRLWDVTVAGRPVTARQTTDATLIPLPGNADPNVPIEVRVRLGKPAKVPSRPVLALPGVGAPVLKTEWNISGDPKHTLAPQEGGIEPPEPALPPTGLAWLARRGLVSMLMVGLLTAVAIGLRNRSPIQDLIALASAAIATAAALGVAGAAFLDIQPAPPLQLSIPVLAAEEGVEVTLNNVPSWRMKVSWIGAVLCAAGVCGLVYAVVKREEGAAPLVRAGSLLLIGLGVLNQRDGGPWFFGLLAVAIAVLILVPLLMDICSGLKSWWRSSRRRRGISSGAAQGSGAEGVATPLLLAAVLLPASAGSATATTPGGYDTADSIEQEWRVSHADQKVTAKATATFSGRPGDRFLLLRAPAVVSSFDGKNLRLTKQQLPSGGFVYVASIPIPEAAAASDDEPPGIDGQKDNLPQSGDPPIEAYRAAFEYVVENQTAQKISVLTGPAALGQVTLTYDQPDQDVRGSSIVRIESMPAPEGQTRVKVLLGPCEATLSLHPRLRDASQEETQFFIETSNLYLPGPGVVDGRHRLRIRASQGQVRELNVAVPTGLTVSDVRGPVGSWRYDADRRLLNIEVAPAQEGLFDILIDTQQSLAPLPTELKLEPLKASGAQGEVGLLALAFGDDAQPEKVAADGVSAVNVSDFDPALLPKKQAVLHRVYRYGASGGSLNVRVAPVAPEVRVLSRQVVSFGDERIVMGVNLFANITRAGLFRLSFPLPEGFEVESLTGPSLNHWSELSADGKRTIVMHLNGKTLGQQKFSLGLAGPTPGEATEWQAPRFELIEASRQTGELVLQPATGIRLRAIARGNVSEADPRALGGKSRGALAFRLLQKDWKLTLAVEKLEPWVTGRVLHEVTLREGQTRSAIHASFNVQNASIRSLRMVLPITDAAELKTVRATGAIVSDFIRTAPESNTWEVRFKRRVVETIEFSIEYERRGDRLVDTEVLQPATFPEARQLAYYYAVRVGGRLELEHGALPSGWEQTEWSALPASIRGLAGRSAPSHCLRAAPAAAPLAVTATRHELADSLKLRVTKGVLTTVLSPTGDQLTAADLSLEVIQRRSLAIALPAGAELVSIFVNNESVHSIRQGNNQDAWRFHVLPGLDERTAKVRFVYTLSGASIHQLSVGGPLLDVPLENIEWNVIAPKGFLLKANEGNLQLARRSLGEEYNRDSYLSKIQGMRSFNANQSAQLLDTANKLLQAGEQKKANWALNSVANQYALDAASNEDARVQLENLQTQQAIVGLNTRRQRFYLDNGGIAVAGDGKEFLEAAKENPILQQDESNYTPQQISQLLRGNSSEANAVLQRIADRLVKHQRTTEPAPQAITVAIPEEGAIYTFARGVQVSENAPLNLDLRFERGERVAPWQSVSACVLLGVLSLLAVLRRNPLRPS
ncbi:MAG: hypothetical protein AAF589_00175 [Planctomycetota bacterium]